MNAPIATTAAAQSDHDTVFRTANESAARSRWDEAITGYSQLRSDGLKAPSLFWNWSQAASASGRKGEARWAMLQAQELTPGDPSVGRELDRLRAELGLDPSEVSLGLWGDLRILARRLRLDLLATLLLALSIAVLAGSRPRTSLSLGFFVSGLLLIAPSWGGVLRGPRGVVVQKDAPLRDMAGAAALALASLREGEVVPVLGEEGEFVRIQDASGARGYAHKNDVRKLGFERE